MDLNHFKFLINHFGELFIGNKKYITMLIFFRGETVINVIESNIQERFSLLLASKDFFHFHFFLCIWKKRFYQLFDSPHLNFQLMIDPSFIWLKIKKSEKTKCHKEKASLSLMRCQRIFSLIKKTCGLNSYACKLK